MLSRRLRGTGLSRAGLMERKVKGSCCQADGQATNRQGNHEHVPAQLLVICESRIL
jgi:hypothetical protein